MKINKYQSRYELSNDDYIEYMNNSFQTLKDRYILKQLYINNEKVSDIAKSLGVSRPRVDQCLSRISRDVYRRKLSGKFSDQAFFDTVLNARESNCLRKCEIDSLDKLMKLTKRELLQIKNLGKKSANDIVNKLEQFLSNRSKNEN